MVTFFLCSIVVALLVEELTGIRPGGFLPAGYLALHLDSPAYLALTFLVAAVVLGGIRLAEFRLLLYGRRRLCFAVLLGAVLGAAATHLGLVFAGGSEPILVVFGLVVPGLLADCSARQGAMKTLGALVFTMAILALLRLVIVR